MKGKPQKKGSPPKETKGIDQRIEDLLKAQEGQTERLKRLE